MAYKKNFFKDKTIVTLSAISVIAAAALIGGIALDSGSKDNTKNIVDLNESDTTKNLVDNDNLSNGRADDITDNITDNITDDITDNTTDSNIANATEGITQELADNETSKDTDIASDINGEVSANAQIDNSGFTLDSLLTWPVDGNIIIDYDMENTVYFPTLDVYKCSDSISIQSDVGTPVYAACDCTITKVASNEEIGAYVVVDLGNSYELTYGQLKDIVVNMDDEIEAGDLIGYVNEPSNYYAVEGPNLYLKLTEAGNPINPLDYLNYE